MDLFQETRPERVQHTRCATDNALQKRSGPGFICVHQRASAAKFLFNQALRTRDWARDQSCRRPGNVQ